MTTTPTLWGNEVTYSLDAGAYNVKVTALQDGTFATTWQNSTDIFGQHFDELGGTPATNFLSGVSTFANNLSGPILTQEEDGTVLVHYGYAFSATDTDIRAATATSDFSTTSSDTSVLASGSDEQLLDATSRVGGGGAIAYNLTSGGTTTLALQFTDNTGHTTGSAHLIDSSATRTEMDPAIVGLSSGNVAIAFESFQNAAPNNRDVRLQIMTPAGGTVAYVVVSDFDKNSAFPDVTELDNGDIVVAWQQTGGIAFRRYHGNGTPIDGAPVLIPGTSASLLPEITHLNDGGFLVAWGQLDGVESDASGEYDSYLQRYDANGNAVGTTFHMDKPGDQYGGSLATLEDGRVVFSYTSETGDSTNVNTVNYQIFDPREHSISGTDGVDNMVGREDGSVIHGLKGNDKLQGRADHDVLYGEGGSDDMFGAAGNDNLVGGVGNDTLKGGSGKDQVYGGFGADSLRGGLGNDIFLYKAVTDSTTNPAGMDTIFDFHRFQDKINLQNIDANTHAGGKQAFEFIGDDSFHNKAGELRIEHTGGDTFVFADRNGDGTEDFAIHLTGTINLKEIDFAL